MSRVFVAEIGSQSFRCSRDNERPGEATIAKVAAIRARITGEIWTMRRICVVLGLAAFVLAAGSDAGRAEITYPWCAQYGAGMDGGGRNCGFWTYQQCMAAL